jgi:hypothetical protein
LERKQKLETERLHVVLNAALVCHVGKLVRAPPVIGTRKAVSRTEAKIDIDGFEVAGQVFASFEPRQPSVCLGRTEQWKLIKRCYGQLRRR